MTGHALLVLRRKIPDGDLLQECVAGARTACPAPGSRAVLDCCDAFDRDTLDQALLFLHVR